MFSAMQQDEEPLIRYLYDDSKPRQAEERLEDTTDLFLGKIFRVGQTADIKSIQKYIVSKTNKNAFLYESNVKTLMSTNKDSTLRFTFQPTSWQFDHRGQRFAHKNYAMEGAVFEFQRGKDHSGKSKKQRIKCIAVTRSSPFEMLSNRNQSKRQANPNPKPPATFPRRLNKNTILITKKPVIRSRSPSPLIRSQLMFHPAPELNNATISTGEHMRFSPLVRHSVSRSSSLCRSSASVSSTQDVALNTCSWSDLELHRGPAAEELNSLVGLSSLPSHSHPASPCRVFCSAPASPLSASSRSTISSEQFTNQPLPLLPVHRQPVVSIEQAAVQVLREIPDTSYTSGRKRGRSVASETDYAIC